MKEKIYTIPVVDGFRAEAACPFCAMYEKLDLEAVDIMLGPSYMEDDIRMETNRMGFCRQHYEKMFAEQNRLGLALMLHTHLQKINNDLASMADDSFSEKKSLFGKKQTASGSKITATLDEIEASCYICNKINNTFQQYIDTFFIMWKENNEVRDYVQKSTGFCINHFNALVKFGEKKLGSAEFAGFLSIALPIQLENMRALENDLDWFIKKFDYRYADEPWNNAKDALPRALEKIASLKTTDA